MDGDGEEENEEEGTTHPTIHSLLFPSSFSTSYLPFLSFPSSVHSSSLYFKVISFCVSPPLQPTGSSSRARLAAARLSASVSSNHTSKYT